MEGNIITITKTKDNVIEFDLTIQGLNTDDIIVRLVVESEETELGFICSKNDKNKWTTTIPELSILDKTAYPFKITVVSDGYYFEPFRGTLNVVKSDEIYVSSPKNTTLTPKSTEEPKVVDDKEEESKSEKDDDKENKKKDTDKDVKESNHKKKSERTIEEIARELMSKPAALHESTAEKKEPAKKSQIIDQVLKELDISVNKKAPKRKFKLH